MAVYGNLKDFKFAQGEDDIRGSNVYGVDGEKLGEIDDVIFDPHSSELKYVVIDTGGWLSSSKFLVPSRQVMEREEDNHFRVALTKEQIERFPAYDEKQLDSEDDWKDYEKRYNDSLSDGPVLHREGSTHVITPTPAEMPSLGGSGKPASGEPFRGIAHNMPRFGATSSSDSSTGHSGGLFSEEADRKSSFPDARVSRGGERQAAEGSLENRVGESDASRIRATSERHEHVHGEKVPQQYEESDRVVHDQERPEELTPRIRQDEAERLGREVQQDSTEMPSEYRAGVMDSGAAPVADIGPEGGRRFREFQERLRRDREQIINRRNRDAA